MRITTQATSEQLRKIHNLMLHCRTKQDMFDHLITIGFNAFNAINMSNSFRPMKSSVTVLAPCEGVAARLYSYNDYSNKLEYKYVVISE